MCKLITTEKTLEVAIDALLHLVLHQPLDVTYQKHRRETMSITWSVKYYRTRLNTEPFIFISRILLSEGKNLL